MCLKKTFKKKLGDLTISDLCGETFACGDVYCSNDCCGFQFGSECGYSVIDKALRPSEPPIALLLRRPSGPKKPNWASKMLSPVWVVLKGAEAARFSSSWLGRMTIREILHGSRSSSQGMPELRTRLSVAVKELAAAKGICVGEVLGSEIEVFTRFGLLFSKEAV